MDFKQWGINTDSKNRKNILLPIAFSKFATVLASGVSSDESANCGYHMVSNNLTSFAYLYGVRVNFIALGI